MPVSRSLYLCDSYAGYQDGRVDLHGLHNAVRPALYPHVRRRFVVFTPLTGGLGEVPLHIDFRLADRDRLVHTTLRYPVRFTDRTTVVPVAVTIAGCPFPEPGLYLVELFCHDKWVCDTTLRLR